MIQQQTRNLETTLAIKPLLRGWFHAVAAACAVALTVVLCWLSWGDIPKLISMLIFVLIAGTYTPLCFNILSGWLRITLLVVIWLLAVLGVSLSIFTLKLPRWVTASLYISMGWVAILALPAFLAILH